MDKDFLTYDEAFRIRAWLNKQNIGFCFRDGVLISRENCDDIINQYIGKSGDRVYCKDIK